jgi:hypothetical protein
MRRCCWSLRVLAGAGVLFVVCRLVDRLNVHAHLRVAVVGHDVHRDRHRMVGRDVHQAAVDHDGRRQVAFLAGPRAAGPCGRVEVEAVGVQTPRSTIDRRRFRPAWLIPQRHLLILAH